MGFNKALIKIDGQSLIQILINRIRPITDRILISSNDCASYQSLNIPVISDHFSGHGPLAGFHSAMLWDASSLYLVLACDLPNLQESFMRKLISLAEGFDAAIPRTKDGLAHPLCSVYRRTCLPYIERALKRGANKVIENFLDSPLSIRWVEPEEGQFDNSDLANINTPEDLSQLKIHSMVEVPPGSTYSS
jgi:molybdenum cofactor guanylyltransferase